MTAPEGQVPVTVTFGRRVRELRAGREWSVDRLADAAGVGASVLYRIECGGNTTLVTAERVAAALGKTLAEMVTPASCGHCQDSPRAGFSCMECGLKGPEVARG